MTGRNWQPGDVAMVTYDGDTRIAVRGDHGWSFGDFHSWLGDSFKPQVRRLAVIDPEDRAQVERLISLFEGMRGDSLYMADNDHMQAALREFANTGPVKPEPTDPTARVTDRRENVWRLLADGDWVCTSGPDIGEYITWERLADERGPLTVEVVDP